MTQVAPVASLPELEQRRGQQREGAGLVLDVREERVDELGLDAGGRRVVPGSSIARRSSSRSHRSDEHVVGPEQLRQRRIGGAAPVEVGPDREHDEPPPRAAGRAHERVDERRALGARRGTR